LVLLGFHLSVVGGVNEGLGALLLHDLRRLLSDVSLHHLVGLGLLHVEGLVYLKLSELLLHLGCLYWYHCLRLSLHRLHALLDLRELDLLRLSSRGLGVRICLLLLDLFLLNKLHGLLYLLTLVLSFRDFD
jgi:hypothetical protein